MQADIQTLFTATFRNPRGVARWLIGMNLPAATGWLALALMAVLSTVLSTLALRLAPIDTDPALAELFGSPVQMVAIQGTVLTLTAMLIRAVGGFFGGKGRLSDALVLVAWVEAVLIILQVGQLLMLVLAPPLAEILGFFAIVVFLWLLSQFIAELHDFRSAGLVFAGIIATVVGLGLAMVVLSIAFFGLGG